MLKHTYWIKTKKKAPCLPHLSHRVNSKEIKHLNVKKKKKETWGILEENMG